MEIRVVEISQLKRAEYNPRKELTPADPEYQQLKKSIVEFGYVVPVVINSDMTVIGGHQGLKVLEDLGYKKIECSVQNLDKTHEKALNLALNKINGIWDNEKLEKILAELKELEFDMDITGFSADELNEIFNDTLEATEDDFDVEKELEEIKEPITKIGDTWILGNQDYQWKHEPCLYGWKDGAAHYFIDDRTQATVIEDKHQDFRKLKKEELVKMLEEIYADKISTTIIEENKPTINDLHPTMKPIKLLSRLIKNSSRIDECVVDLFGGSGSTLIACEQLSRPCYMMELDPKYCDVIVKRWETLTGKKAELEKK